MMARTVLYLALAAVALGVVSCVTSCEHAYGQEFSVAYTKAAKPDATATDIIKSDLINAPDSVPLGRTFLVIIKGDTPFEIKPVPTTLVKLRDDDGNRVLFVANAQSPGYTITVNYVVVHPTDAEIAKITPSMTADQIKTFLKDHSADEVYQDTATVQVGDQPEPPGPDLDGLSKDVLDNATKVGNPEQAQQIAKNYSAIISAISAGAYNSLSFTDARAKIVGDVFQANHTITQSNAKWDGFFQWLSSEAKSLDEAGKLSTVDEIKSMFLQIQKGLEAVK